MSWFSNFPPSATFQTSSLKRTLLTAHQRCADKSSQVRCWSTTSYLACCWTLSILRTYFLQIGFVAPTLLRWCISNIGFTSSPVQFSTMLPLLFPTLKSWIYRSTKFLVTTVTSLQILFVDNLLCSPSHCSTLLALLRCCFCGCHGVVGCCTPNKLNRELFELCTTCDALYFYYMTY